MTIGTESFNEANVAADFKEIMANADLVRKALANGNNDIDAVIGNRSLDDAWSGSAAMSVKNQWADLASTFENFLSNFQHWYDQQTEAARAMRNFESNTQTVNMEK